MIDTIFNAFKKGGGLGEFEVFRSFKSSIVDFGQNLMFYVLDDDLDSYNRS